MYVRITISGEGLSYEGETTVSKAAQVIAFVSAVNETPTSANGYRESTDTNLTLARPATNSISPREFLLKSEAKSNPQKIVVLGKYIAERNDSRTFTTKALQETFRLAGERMPANLNRDITIAIASGTIAPAEVRGDFYVTNLGESQIESQFANATGFSRAAPRASRSQGPRAGLSEEIKNVEIGPLLEGFPGYWDSKFKDNKSARILWLLQFVSVHGVNELSASDIDYLAKQLGDDIKANTVPSKIIGLQKKGFVARTTAGRYRLLKPGVDFLQSVD